MKVLLILLLLISATLVASLPQMSRVSRVSNFFQKAGEFFSQKAHEMEQEGHHTRRKFFKGSEHAAKAVAGVYNEGKYGLQRVGHKVDNAFKKANGNVFHGIENVKKKVFNQPPIVTPGNEYKLPRHDIEMIAKFWKYSGMSYYFR